LHHHVEHRDYRGTGFSWIGAHPRRQHGVSTIGPYA
jgi:hypothetical protein